MEGLEFEKNKKISLLYLNMRKEPIYLRCLVKGSLSHLIVKELKSDNGEMDKGELINKLGGFEILRIINGVYLLSPAVVKSDSKISINSKYDFLITTQPISSSIQNRCRVYNEQLLEKDDFYPIPIF